MTRRTAVPLIACGLLASPVFVGASYSVLAWIGLAGAGRRGLSLDAVRAVMESHETWRSLAWTLATAGTATVAAGAAALYAAVQVRHSRAGRILATLPMAVPHAAAALAALLMLSQSGLLSRVMAALGVIDAPMDFPALVYDRAGVALMVAFAWKEFPYLTLTALAVLPDDAAQLEETARTLGATGRQAFWRVTWPGLWRGVLPAMLAAFAFLAGQYEMPALLAPSSPVAFPLLTYERSVTSQLAQRGEAYGLGLVALAVTGLIVAIHAVSTARVERAPR